MHVVLSTQRPCQHPAEPCGRACRYRLHGRATCALVVAQCAHEPSEIAALAGWPLLLLNRDGREGMRRPIHLPVSDADLFRSGDEITVGSKGVFRVEAVRGVLLIRRLWWRTLVWRVKAWWRS